MGKRGPAKGSHHRVLRNGPLSSKYRVEEESHPVLGTPCWIWCGAQGRNGRPYVKWKGRTELAYRVVYEEETGESLGGLEGDHLCEVLLCVNPSHIKPEENGAHQSKDTRRRWKKWGSQKRPI